MLVELLKWLVLVILTGNICADLAESIELFLDLLSGCLYVGSHSLEVLLVIHLGSCISDDFNVFWKKLIAILCWV